MIRVADFEYNILVTEAAETFSLGEKIQFGFSTIEFLSLGRKQEKQLDDSIVRPLFLHAGVGSLYLNLVGTGIRPLIEPFSYVATIRRVHGMRFLDMFSGYEIIGQQNETTKEADRHDKNYGLVLHFSPERLQTLQKMGELFSTGSQQLEADFDLDAFKTESMKIPRDTTRSSLIHFAGGLLFVFCMAVFIFFLIQIVAPVYAIIISLGIVATLRDLTKRLKVLRLVTACESRGKNAAVFRFPISFISVIAPNDTRMTLSDVSLLGRLDGSMLHFSASSFELDPSSSQTTPRLSMSGLRALVKNDTKLLNIESINELGIPGVLKVVKPVLMTVVRFEENSVKIKLNFVEADLLSIKENPSEIEHGGMNEVNQKSESSTDTVNAKEEREMVNAEIYREAEKLKYIAMMFEKIPVQSNRHNLRLYPNSFRGAEAVEYILESKLAKSRHEAVKLTRDLQVEFNLFQHVTREFNFRDEHDCLFRFTDVKKRRNWGNGDSPFSTRMSLDHNSIESPPLPFPTIVNIQEIVLNDGDSGAHVISLRNFELDAKSAKTVGAIDFTLFSGEIENKMIFLRGARVRALVHPDLPTELHKLQFSIEALHASPGYTTEDWYAMFGFSDKTSESSRQPEQDDTSQQTASDFLLPFAYIAPFNLHLSFSGIFIAARESTMSVNSFIGSEETTSNDLIKHFVNGILGRAPGILAKVRVLGVNVVESAGIATSMSVGFRFLPFGHYLGLGALAVYDGAAAAIDAGKAARDDPNDRWRPGDIARGIAHGAGQAARKGAEMRGKIHFDDNDKVDVDPLDFALGTTNATLTYVYGNKARFAGATVGKFSYSMIASPSFLYVYFNDLQLSLL